MIQLHKIRLSESMYNIAKNTILVYFWGTSFSDLSCHVCFHHHEWKKWQNTLHLQEKSFPILKFRAIHRHPPVVIKPSTCHLFPFYLLQMETSFENLVDKLLLGLRSILSNWFRSIHCCSIHFPWRCLTVRKVSGCNYFFWCNGHIVCKRFFKQPFVRRYQSLSLCEFSRFEKHL